MYSTNTFLTIESPAKLSFKSLPSTSSSPISPVAKKIAMTRNFSKSESNVNVTPTKPIVQKIFTSSQKKRLHYPGDFAQNKVQDTETVHQLLNIQKLKLEEKTAEIKTMKRKNRNLTAENNLLTSKVRKLDDIASIHNTKHFLQITNLESALNELKEKGLLTENGFENMTTFSKQLTFQELKNVKCDRNYSPAVKQFAITLSYYSISAYEYLKNTLKVPLPTIRTIQMWCSSVEGAPGLTNESIKTIQEFVANRKEKGKPTFFCLLMDEMSIKRSIEERNGEVYGYVNFGSGAQDEECLMAKYALVFMLSAINCRLKLPVAYFLTASTNASDKSSFISALLLNLYRKDIDVRCITFDGPVVSSFLLSLFNTF